MQYSTFALATTFAAGVLARDLPGWSLKHEHAGSVFSKSQHYAQPWCEQGVLHDEEPRGYLQEYDGETLYITNPPPQYGRHGPPKAQPPAAILYLTDIFGLGIPNNKLLADSLASADYLVVVPDLFRGDPVPGDALSSPDSTFDFAAWQAAHPESEINSIINSTIATMHSVFNVQNLGTVGYCFGGPYVAGLLTPDSPVSAEFTAHPSGVEPEAWQAITKPISVAYGAKDENVPVSDRREAEDSCVSGNKTFELSLYAEAEHGFAVRTDLSVKALAFAQESAYFQAVRWLDGWVKDLPIVDDE